MRSLSKTFCVPIDRKELQSKQIQQALIQIMERQEEILNERISKQYLAENKIKKVEADFQKILQQKQQKFRMKLLKSEKNRNQFLSKIVKKCKDKDKIYNEKVKNAFSKRRQSLRQAWKAANKFNQKILQARQVKPSSYSQNKLSQIELDQDLNKSIILPEQGDEQINQSNQIQGMRNTSKVGSTAFANNNLLKSNDPVAFFSTFNIQRKTERAQKKYAASNPSVIRVQLPARLHTTEGQINPQINYQSKLRRIMSRHQQQMMEEENKKIQQLGETLQKIAVSRERKEEKWKSLKKEVNNDDYYNQDTVTEQPKKPKNNRIKSESLNYDRVRKTSDWSELNKRRREQILMMQIENGNQYLSENKIRHFKQVMSKNAAYSTIEKKLYFDRLKH